APRTESCCIEARCTSKNNMEGEMRVRIAGIFVCASVLALGCREQIRETSAPDFEISDALHQNGTAGFFFLPPMVRAPAYTGTFDADITTLNPEVAIC